MNALATREAPSLTEYQSQGLGHIVKLSAIVTAGTILVSAGGTLLFAAPLALAVVYQMFRSAGKVKDPDWCQSRNEIWDYKLSPKHSSLAESYEQWCCDWGRGTVNSLIEPMIGNCEIANFTKDKKHPYYGLRGVLVYDDEEDAMPPLTPHDYVRYWLEEREKALNPQKIETVQGTKILSFAPISEQPVAAAQTTITADPQKAIALLLKLTNPPLQPVIIAGLPGSGKGFLAAAALGLGVQKNGVKYWLFNPKNKLAEAGYWARAERHYLKNRLQNDEALFIDLMEVLEEFSREATNRNDTPGEYQPFILLLEELTAIVGLFTPKQKQEFKAKVVALMSLIRGCNMALWVSGQSVNLEDLGLTGRSNRAVFTAIAAVSGSKADGLEAICKPLQIPFASVPVSEHRYWLTANEGYEAPVINCPVPNYNAWSDVPNLIDLRPGMEAQSGGAVDALFEEPKPIPVHRRPIRIHRPTSQPPTEKKELPPAIKRAIAEHQNDAKLCDFLKWLGNREKGEMIDLRIIQGSRWAKNYGRSKEDIDPVLIEAIRLDLLTEIGTDQYRVED